MNRFVTFKPSNYPQVYAFMVSCLVVALVFVNILVSAQVSYWGYQSSQLALKANYLSEANRLLKEDIAKQTSLTKLLNDATALNYNSTVAYIRLRPLSPMAMSPNYQP